MANDQVKIETNYAANGTAACRDAMDNAVNGQGGFTLVEAMVAMVIGLLLAIVAGAIFVESRQSFRLQDNFAQIQEGGRAVLEDVTKELRKAGSYGCFRWKDDPTGIELKAKIPNSSAGDFPIPTNGGALAFEKVWDVRGGPVAGLAVPTGSGITVAAGTDYVQVMYGQPVANVADASYGLAAAPALVPIPLNHSIQVAIGQPFLVSDCDSMTLLRTDSNGTVSSLTQGAGNNPNSPAVTSNHAQGSTVMTFQVTAFFVGTDASGVKSLYRWDVAGNSAPQPMVANVDDMRVIFGIDGGTANPGTTVSTWAPGGSTTPWNRIITVAVHLVMRSNDAALAPSPISFTWDATKRIFVQGTSGSDLYVRRPYIINAVVRSRAPITP